MNPAPFAYWLHAFFHEWLAEQRNCSRHTVLSYRDTWRLYLRFVAARRRRPVSALTLTEPTADEVLAFLKHVESERRASIGTRNCRLAAIRSFYRFVADREPLAAMQCAAVLRIPMKKGSRPELAYLDSEEVAAILRQPDRSTPEGQRDHALLAFLYNTGARIQEALGLCPSNIRLATPAQVKLYGKGRKERICPLWPETAARCRRGPVQARAVRACGCEGATGVAEKARAPAHVPPYGRRPAGCRQGRCYGDQELARARQPRYDKPLRAGEPRDQATCPRSGRPLNPAR